MRHTLLVLALLTGITVAAVSDEQVHVLERGQTIYTLARLYNVAAQDLLDYNDIADPTKLPVGARIRIPGTYTVSEGEYVYSIARDLDIDWLDLLELNNLDRDDVVRPGDVLLVPRRPDSAGPKPAPVVPDEPEPIVSLPVEQEPEGDNDTVHLLEWPHPGVREPWDGRFRGVVMSGEPGDVFRSVATGVVSFVGPFTSFGKLILVRSENGYLYGYAGADRVDVTQGQRVDNGTVLGSVGVSPAFQSARVLFTVWHDNRYIDPQRAPRG